MHPCPTCGQSTEGVVGIGNRWDHCPECFRLLISQRHSDSTPERRRRRQQRFLRRLWRQFREQCSREDIDTEALLEGLCPLVADLLATRSGTSARDWLRELERQIPRLHLVQDDESDAAAG